MAKQDVIDLKKQSAWVQAENSNRPAEHQKVGVFLTDAFSLLSLTSLTDIFCAVKTVSTCDVVETVLISVSGRTVRSHSGVTVTTDLLLPEQNYELDMIKSFDLFIICSGVHLSQEETNKILKIMRTCKRFNVPVCIIGSAIGCVARIGYIRKGTDHWSRIPSIRENSPEFELENAIFVQDGKIYSCAGELGVMDFALDWIRKRFGTALVSLICNQLLILSCRLAHQTQTCSAENRFRGVPEKLIQIIKLMLSNIEQPISMHEISKVLGISVRQIERLFSRHLSISPVKFYIKERLDISINLIKQTNMTYLEVSLACGFGSPSSLSRHLRNIYGKTPSELRKHIL